MTMNTGAIYKSYHFYKLHLHFIYKNVVACIKTAETYFLTVPVQSQGVGRTTFPQKARGSGVPSLPLPASGGPRIPWLWQDRSSLCLLPCVSVLVSQLPLLLLMTPVNFLPRFIQILQGSHFLSSPLVSFPASINLSSAFCVLRPSRSPRGNPNPGQKRPYLLFSRDCLLYKSLRDLRWRHRGTILVNARCRTGEQKFNLNIVLSCSS